MKKIGLYAFIAVLATGGALFAQDKVEDAPTADVTEPAKVEVTEDKAEYENDKVNVTADEDGVTITYLTDEEEIVATGGTVYFNGTIDYVSADVSFQIQAEDEGSGVKAIYVVMDSKDSFEYSAPITTEVEGKHAFTYRVEDNVGNMSEAQSYEFIMDATAPVVKAAAGTEPVIAENVIYFGVDQTVKLSAVDYASGVAAIYYKVDDGEVMTYEGSAFEPKVEDGAHSITYWAIDNVGNVSTKVTYNFFKDSTGPSAEITLSPAAYEKFDVLYISASTLVDVVSEDGETEVSRVTYSINGGDFVEYTDAFTLEAGTYEIAAIAYDLLGNESDKAIIEVVVDGSKPSASVIPMELD